MTAIPSAVCVACGTPAAVLSGYCPACKGVLRRSENAAQSVGITGLITPLVASRAPGLDGTLLKVETVQPTGSFKDRVMRVLVAEAKAANVPGAVVASSGNAATAAAAACAIADLPLLVIAPTTLPDARLRPAEAFGPGFLRVGHDPSGAHHAAAQIAERFGLANLVSTFAAPGCEWACRGIGHELHAQSSHPITHLVAPVSVGPVLVGAGAGIVEAGGKAPALWAAQAAGCAPIASAFQSGAAVTMAWDGVISTQAYAIADRLSTYAHEADLTLAAIRETRGLAGAVTDEEMRQMRQDLARYDGLDVELSACAGAALWRRQGRSVDGIAVCVLTGNGMKETLAQTADLRSAESFAAATGFGAELVKEVQQWLTA